MRGPGLFFFGNGLSPWSTLRVPITVLDSLINTSRVPGYDPPWHPEGCGGGSLLAITRPGTPVRQERSPLDREEAMR